MGAWERRLDAETRGSAVANDIRPAMADEHEDAEDDESLDEETEILSDEAINEEPSDETTERPSDQEDDEELFDDEIKRQGD